jgi:PAC2 family
MGDPSTNIVWDREPELLGLNQPILVLALEGWFDVARTATGAVAALAAHGAAHTIATISCENFVDVRAHRPQIHLDDGELVELLWPDTVLELVRGGRRDLLLLSGVEPDYRWKSYVDAICEIAVRCRAELVVTLGAALAMVPHRSTVQVSSSASTAAIARQLGLPLPTYQGITGVVGVVQEQLAVRAIPGVSLRVPVPHYLNTIGFPPGRQALLNKVCALTGSSMVTTDDDDWAAEFADLLEEHPELPAHIAQLEHQHNSEPEVHDTDRLISDIERYLDSGPPDGL